ncbi:MAG TPA: hypothetical protein VFI45_17305 [Candidatus Acidoferrum sp.]|nr:hypothetical protein [Candidatus Acidoferrum sp.]
MSKTGLVLASLLLILSFGCQPARADSGVTYSVSGVYSPDTTASQLSGASDTFSMSFTLPAQPVTTDFIPGDDFFVDAPIPFSFSASNGGTASGLVYLSFYSPTSIYQPGGFFVDFCADGPSCATGLEYQWEVPGPLLYSGPESSPTLTPTSFDFTGGQFTLFHCTTCDNVDASGTFTGSVNVVAAPEPSSALFLLLGALCLFTFSSQLKRLA